MDSRLAPFNHLCRSEGWKSFEPKARPLCLSMAELPRLDGLIVTSSHQAFSILVHHGVLYCDLG